MILVLFLFFFTFINSKDFLSIPNLIKLYRLFINYLQNFNSLLNLLELPWSLTRIYCTTVTPIATNSYLPTGWWITLLRTWLFVMTSMTPPHTKNADDEEILPHVWLGIVQFSWQTLECYFTRIFKTEQIIYYGPIVYELFVRWQV